MVCPCRAVRPLTVGGQLVIWLLVCPTAARAENQDATQEYHLRMAWGGAAPRDWQGTVTLHDGSVTDFQPLGTDPDIPGSILATPTGLMTSTLRPQRYQAMDLTIRGSPTAGIQVRLTTRADPTLQFAETIPLSTIQQEPVNRDLDDHGNRLLIRTAPGDPLHVRFVREHLVFAPRETWQLDIEPAPIY